MHRNDILALFGRQDGKPRLGFGVRRQCAIVGKNDLGRVAAFQRYGRHVFECGHTIGNVGVAETVALPCHLGPHRRALETVAQSVADVFEMLLARIQRSERFGVRREPGGEVVADLPEEMETVAVSGVEKPPNQVRLEAGLGIPVAVKDASGKVEEKRVKYADPQFMEQAREKGK